MYIALGQNKINCSHINHDDWVNDFGQDYDDCNDADYDDEIREVEYHLNNVETMFMGTCYQVYSRLSKSIDVSTTPFELVMDFSESMPYEKLPSRIHVFITSDANSHGIILNEWREGNELHFIFSKV